MLSMALHYSDMPVLVCRENVPSSHLGEEPHPRSVGRHQGEASYSYGEANKSIRTKATACERSEKINSYMLYSTFCKHDFRYFFQSHS